MSEPQSSWAFVGISPEARQAAELAAEAAGMELDTWLAQLIKYKSTMELRGKDAVSLDDAIMQIAAPDEAAAQDASPGDTPHRSGRDEADPAAARADDTSWPRPVPRESDKTALEPGTRRTPPPVPQPNAGSYQRDDHAASGSDLGHAEQDEPEKEADAPPGHLPRRSLPTESLRPSRLSALNHASEEAIQGAFDGWRDSRTLEPLLVRPAPDERNTFEVIVGVERWHAARRAHIRELPAIVYQATDEEAIRLAMSARLKRGPLSPLDEANIYLSLMSEAGMSTEQVARMVGKPPAHIATMVRVTSLPRAVRDMLERGELTALHARALLEAPNAEALAREAVARRLDIYQTEQLVRIASLRSEQSEKVEFGEVDLDFGDGDLSGETGDEFGEAYEAPPPSRADLDGETGFGMETLLGGEARPAHPRPGAPEADPFGADLTEEDLLLDEGIETTAETADSLPTAADIPEDSYALVEAPEEAPLEDMLAAEPRAAASATAGENARPSIPGHDSPPGAPSSDVASDDRQDPAPGASDSDDDATPASGTPEEPPADLPNPFAHRAARRTAAPDKKGVVTTELLEHHLSHLLGLKVAISERENVGVISLHYTSREELSDIVARLNSGSPR